ncbi:uncharacterized protein LAESUDRAFT_816904, partial [Laetiporus sulphureus 93-53]
MSRERALTDPATRAGMGERRTSSRAPMPFGYSAAYASSAASVASTGQRREESRERRRGTRPPSFALRPGVRPNSFVVPHGGYFPPPGPYYHPNGSQSAGGSPRGSVKDLTAAANDGRSSPNGSPMQSERRRSRPPSFALPSGVRPSSYGMTVPGPWQSGGYALPPFAQGLPPPEMVPYFPQEGAEGMPPPHWEGWQQYQQQYQQHYQQQMMQAQGSPQMVPPQRQGSPLQRQGSPGLGQVQGNLGKEMIAGEQQNGGGIPASLSRNGSAHNSPLRATIHSLDGGEQMREGGRGGLPSMPPAAVMFDDARAGTPPMVGVPSAEEASVHAHKPSRAYGGPPLSPSAYAYGPALSSPCVSLPTRSLWPTASRLLRLLHIPFAAQ